MRNLSTLLPLDYCCLQICPMKTHMTLLEVSILFVAWSIKKVYIKRTIVLLSLHK